MTGRSHRNRKAGTRAVLMIAVGALLVGAVLAVKPTRETREDLQRETDAIHVDYLRVNAELFADIDDPIARSNWVDCDRVAQEATRLLGEMRSQFGVLAFSARLNSAVAEGCQFKASGPSLARLLDHFDSILPRWRWPLFAKVIMRVDDRPGDLRATLIQGRLRAECAGGVVARLRAAEAAPDRDRVPALIRHCWDDDQEWPEGEGGQQGRL
jgi:hypothetical protein